MNDQPTLFDAAAAMEARALGIEQVSEGEDRGAWLSRVRIWALAYLDAHDTITSDDVRRVWTLPAGFHFNTWGAVFNDRRFESTGAFTRSAIVQGHGNRIAIWRRRRP